MKIRRSPPPLALSVPLSRVGGAALLPDTPHVNDEYPESDFPWNFYFNGEGMPKWGACWGMARVASFLQPERDADQDVGHRDIYITCCQIDHVGVVESADPDVFIYAVQEVLHIFL